MQPEELISYSLDIPLMRMDGAVVLDVEEENMGLGVLMIQAIMMEDIMMVATMEVMMEVMMLLIMEDAMVMQEAALIGHGCGGG